MLFYSLYSIAKGTGQRGRKEIKQLTNQPLNCLLAPTTTLGSNPQVHRWLKEVNTLTYVHSQHFLHLRNAVHSYYFLLFKFDLFTHVFLLGGAAPTHRWGRKEGTPAQSWLGIVRATGPDPFRHCLHPNTHLHYIPQCEVTPAGFANCL